METVKVLFVIAFGVWGLFWVLRKWLGKLPTGLPDAPPTDAKQIDFIDPGMIQAGFLADFIRDTTQEQFFDKSKQDAIIYGQDLLWKEIALFNAKLGEALKNGIGTDDFELLNSATRVVKIVHIMLLIEQDGPVSSEDPTKI